MLLTQMVKLQAQSHLESERNAAVMSALLLKINSMNDTLQLANMKNNLSKTINADADD